MFFKNNLLKIHIETFIEEMISQIHQNNTRRELSGKR